jgi:hypothetical protein
MFDKQALRAEPFIETDDRPGFYFGSELKLNRRALVSAMHYDNHADPLSLRDGQYGWRTRFDHIGAQIELPADFGLVAQWMKGITFMGPVVNGARVVDTQFESYFVMLTKRVAKHRVSLRFDDFVVIDRDDIPLDDNGETGRAWTAAYRYDHSERLHVKFEWLQIDSERASGAYLGLPVRGTERLAQLRLYFRLGPHAR